MKRFACLLISVFLSCTILPSYQIYADDREGYSLTPDRLIEGGVDPAGSYRLTTPDKTDIETLAARLCIDGEEAPELTALSDQEFMITPSSVLQPHHLYTFRLARDGAADITWVFQTAEEFRLAQVFPADRATNVPINTGIEITFNYEGFDGNLEEYFTITPKLPGRFEKHGKTTVFVPDAPLSYETVYTVTIDKGIQLEGTEFQTPEGRQLAFETAPENKPEREERVTYGYLGFQHTEFTSMESPVIPYYASLTAEEAQKFHANVTVWAYSSPEEYAKAYKALKNTWDWSFYNTSKSVLDQITPETTALTYSQKMIPYDKNDDEYQRNYLQLPQALPEGFYLVAAELGGHQVAAMLTVSDLAFFYQQSSSQTLVWLNDISKDAPAAGATLTAFDSGMTCTADDNGIALLDKPVENPYQSELFLAEAKGHQPTVVELQLPEERQEYYWAYLETDRLLYQPEDTVSYWGFVQNRYEPEEINSLTVEISQPNYYWGWWQPKDPLVKDTTTVSGGSYGGSLRLPYLTPGSYQLTVKKDDQIISSQYFTVATYVKPDYKLTLAADKRAVFEGEEIGFRANASFFEGTPLPDLAVDYRVDRGSGTVHTDEDGMAAFTYTPPETIYQEITSFTANAHAQLPESGEISASSSIRLFRNDAELSAHSQYDSEAGRFQLKTALHSIDLSRINNGTNASYSDYLGEPLAGRTISGKIVHQYYKAEKIGTRYDYINKKTYPVFHYTLTTDPVSDFTIETDGDGAASFSYDLKRPETGSYYAELTCSDSSGKSITKSVYLTTYKNDYPRSLYHPNTGKYLELQTDQKTFAVGDEIPLGIKDGEQAAEGSRFLFIVAQNGITRYQTTDQPETTVTFQEDDIPRAFVRAVIFNGSHYNTVYNTAALSLDTTTRRLALTVTPDKASYRPGETCTLSIAASSPDGQGRPATVNINMVDEALFALRNQNIDILRDLFGSITSGLKSSYSSHQYSRYDGSEPDEPRLGSGAGGGSGGAPSAPMADEKEPVRSSFKDTAFSKTVTLDETGHGSITFALPDNITSWRLTASGVTQDLYAGTVTQNLTVSQPFFISCAIADSFLAGDRPTVGVTPYGDGLTAGDEVTITIVSKNDPGKSVSSTGLAFKRTDLPLWELQTGEDALIIRAVTANGTADAIEHSITISSTYHETTRHAYDNLTAGIQLPAGEKGLSTYTFTDRSRGAVLNELLRFTYLCGNRIDQSFARKLSYDLIQKYGDDELKQRFPKPVFHAADYQKGGGLTLLPYGEADLDTTVKLLPYIKDEEIDKTAMLSYLYGISGNPENEGYVPNAKALYGLAVYGEPVLLQLDEFTQIENIGVTDSIYCALAYCLLGETAKAAAVYEARVAPFMEEAEPYYRINTGDSADLLEATAICAVLASRLGLPEKEGLYQYATRNTSDETLVNMERIQYAASEIERHSETSCKITYQFWGEEHTMELRNGACRTITMASANADQLKITDVAGEAAVLSVFSVPMTELVTESPDIYVERSYTAIGSGEASKTFGQTDVVRVDLTVWFGEKALQSSYEVTDYLPAGLKYMHDITSVPLGNGMGYYVRATLDGPKIRFYTSNHQEKYVYSYYARVVSPGTFHAEGTTVQSTQADGVIQIAPDDIITIE